MKKRIFSLLLIAVILIGIFPTGAFAQDVEALPEENPAQELLLEPVVIPEIEEILLESEITPETPTESEPVEDEPVKEEPAEEIIIEPMEKAEIEPAEKNEELEEENFALLLSEDPESIGTVRVSIVNNTFSVYDGAPWDGVLIDTYVNLYVDSSMMSCVIDALGEIPQEGAEYNYIISINGLNAGDGGYMSGWMGTLNDWFTNEGFGAYTVASGTLQSGDEICLLYTCDFGSDCGGSWDNNDKTLSALTFSAGQLIPDFDSRVHDYTLVVPTGTAAVYVTPTAANKNFQVHTFVGGTAFKRSESVPVTDGAVISVIDGDPSWSSMNGGSYGTADEIPAEVYNITVMHETGINITVRSQMNGAYLSGFGSPVYVSSAESERFGYSDSVTGVSALDALVAAHEMYFGDSFTPNTASVFLNVGSGGYITTVFGVETTANGFLINGAYPNDGTESEWGGYNGTTVTTQQVYTGDVIDFYTYSDASGWSDFYTYLSLPQHIYAGREFTVNVSGTPVMNGYFYADASSFASAAVPISGAAFAWVNSATGEATVLSEICSDENGNAVLTAPDEGTYLLTASGFESAPFCLMNPQIVTVETAELISSPIVIRTSNSTTDLSNAILAGENDLGIAVFNPSVYEYSLGDILTDANSQLRFYFDFIESKATAMLFWNDATGTEKSKDITKTSARFANCLHVGQNTLTLTITSSDGLSDTYVFHVGCVPTLTSLNVRSEDAALYLDTAFAATDFDYVLTMPSSAGKIFVDALPKNSDYTLLINGGGSFEVSPVGDNVTLEVVSADGTGSLYTLSIRRVAKLDLIIVPSPADAVVRVYDQTGTEIYKNADGSYSGMFAEYAYTYTVTKYGYVAVSETVPAQSGKLDVVLQSAPETDIEDVDAPWSNFRGSDDNMGITETELPTDAEDTELLWANKLGSGWQNAPSVQIIVDDSLIVMCGTSLYKLALSTGEILAVSEMIEAPSYGYTPPTYAEGMIFCPLGKGTVQAFNASTLESLWVYRDVLGGQALSPITYCDGYIYTGFWTSYTDKASYVCISVTDEDPAQTLEAKQACWRLVNDGGYYWAGSLTVGKAVIFGSEDGSKDAGGNPRLYSIDRFTGQPVSVVELNGVGDIRSTIAYDADASKIFFTTADGYLCSAYVNAQSGEISDVKAVYYNAKSTSTPVVYKGRVFFGTGSGITTSGSSGNFVIADASTLQMINYIGLRGYPQCSALLSTAYENEGFLCFYCTYNSMPGGITMIKVNTGNFLMELTELYDAQGYEQYCITSLICDKDGTIYYKNDSGNIMAVGFSDAARTRKLIDSIGTVTADSWDKIAAANEVYLKLSDADKVKVTNYSVLEKAIEEYELLLGNIAAVELSISSIGTVTADSEDAIKDAWEKFNALSESEKEKVSNYSLLTAAEAAYSNIKAQITAVEKKISAIGTVNANSENLIASARDAYDALPTSSKRYVSNYQILTSAEARFTQLENAAEVVSLISAIGTVTTSSGSKITAARNAYNALTTEEKALVTNYSVLTAAETKYASLTTSSSGTTTTAVTKTVSTSTTKNTDSETTVEINGKKYTVDVKAAELMTTICALAERGNVQENEIISLYRIYSALTDELKKQIYNYSDLEKLMDKLGERNHKDAASGISASGLEWNEKLNISVVDSGTEYGFICGSIGQNRLIRLVRITYTDILTGKKLDNVSDVQISVPASKSSGETAIEVYRFDNMELQRVSFSEKNGELSFNARSGELFAIVGITPGDKAKDEAQDREVNADQDTVSLPLTWIAAGGAGVAVLITVLFIELLRKKE